MAKFSKGDIVKKRYGTVLHTVESNDGSWLRVRNNNTNKLDSYANQNEYVIIESYDKMIKEREMTKLYEFEYDGKTVFGTQLAINSANKAVMEIKGSDIPVVVDRSILKEVMPYTVTIKGVRTSSVMIIEAKEGSLKLGDILISKDGNFHTVTKLDTKTYVTSKSPNIISKVKTEKFII